MTAFFRFPHTPHLAWLGTRHPRGDKVLAPDEVEVLLAGDVVVEEKVDGANIGFSTNEDGEVRVQNRGQYLDRAHSHGQFQPLWSWFPSREAALADALYPDLILFGEWCYAVHSVTYNRLPDWFLGFDVYDRTVDEFWDTGRRDGLLAALGLAGIPRLAEGGFTLEQLAELLPTPSRVGGESLEGIVVRKEADGLTTTRAKLVRPEFAQTIGEHWSRGPLRRNELTQGAAPWR
jgi:hypothetical protein